MNRRNFLVDIIFWILAFFFGYTIKKESENLSLLKKDTMTAVEKDRNNLVAKNLVADALYVDGNNNYFKDYAHTIPATDNSPAWEALINSTPEGVKIYIPSGKMYFSRALITRKGMHMYGAKETDDGVTELYIKDVNGNGICLTPTSDNVKISNLYIKCHDLTKGSVISVVGNSSGRNYVIMTELENLWAVGAKYGVYAVEAYRFTMKNVTAAYNGTGFYLSNVTTMSDIAGCWAYSNSGSGWDLSDCHYGRLVACGADYNKGYAYYLINCSGYGLLYSGAENNTKRAIHVHGGNTKIDGFVSVNNGSGDKECSMLYAQNGAVVSMKSCVEESETSNITNSITNNDSNIDFNMSQIKGGLFSTANARNYGKLYIGADIVTDYKGIYKEVVGTPETITVSTNIGDIVINPSYSPTSPVKSWICMIAGSSGNAGFTVLDFSVQKGVTANRPSLHSYDAGVQYIDTSLNNGAGMLIVWNGKAWIVR